MYKKIDGNLPGIISQNFIEFRVISHLLYLHDVFDKMSNLLSLHNFQPALTPIKPCALLHYMTEKNWVQQQ